MVMYAGRKVEEAPVKELFANPLHPYTQGLLGAVPKLGASIDGHSTRLKEIPGLVPSLKNKIQGCVFASRCPLAKGPCHDIAPAMQIREGGHQVACHFAGEVAFAND
jgi:peptide/nickel transport system ATP-binding protein